MTQAAMAARTVGRIHTAGAACLAAGSGGVLATIYLAMVSPLGAENFIYPHVLRPASAFGGLQVADRTAEPPPHSTLPDSERCPAVLVGGSPATGVR